MIHTEFVYREAPFAQCHASTIAETPAGLACAFFAGTHEKHQDVGIWLVRKVNGGDAWNAPVEVADGVVTADERYPCWNPVLYQDPGGPLLLFYKVGPNCSDWWGMLTRSDDDGETWSAPERLPGGIWGPIKNKPVRLADGSLLCGTSGEATGWQVYLQRTPDLGRTWASVGPLNDKDEVAAIQPTILCWPNGRVQILCRTRQGSITTCWSEDGGASWSPMGRTVLPNNNSGIDAVMLSDGRALLVYNHVGRLPDGRGGPRTPLNVALSSDGVSWSAALVLETEPGEYSYPAVIQSADGRVLITSTWRRQRVRHVELRLDDLAPVAMVEARWPEGMPAVTPAE